MKHSSSSTGSRRTLRQFRHLASANESALIFVLALVQFTNVLDFVIMMPLGPQLMRLFQITPAAFGILVSAYTAAAAVFGFVLSLFVDHLDRKKALLWIYGAFTLATLLCGLSDSYATLFAARAAAGASGGVLQALTFSIIGDRIPENRRGSAMGVVMSSFSVASIIGVPFGLAIAARFTWEAPFLLLAQLSALTWLAVHFLLPPMREHLAGARTGHAPSGRGLAPLGNSLRNITSLFADPNAARSFALTVALSFAMWTVIPYLSTFMVRNVGVAEADLAWVYLVGGLFTFFGSRTMGYLSDVHGKIRVFTVAALLAPVPVALMTNLPALPLSNLLVVSTMFMVLMNARFVPATAIITASVEPARRGSFMSLNSALQHISSALASALGGWILVQSAEGPLGRFGWNGAFSIAMGLLAIPIARGIRGGRT